MAAPTPLSGPRSTVRGPLRHRVPRSGNKPQGTPSGRRRKRGLTGWLYARHVISPLDDPRRAPCPLRARPEGKQRGITGNASANGAPSQVSGTPGQPGSWNGLFQTSYAGSIPVARSNGLGPRSAMVSLDWGRTWFSGLLPRRGRRWTAGIRRPPSAADRWRAPQQPLPALRAVRWMHIALRTLASGVDAEAAENVWNWIRVGHLNDIETLR